MKKVILLSIFFALALRIDVSAQKTGADLIADLRARTNEVNAAESSFPDSVALRWLNMAQSKIVRLGGYLMKDTLIVLTGDVYKYYLSADFKKAMGCLEQSGGNYYAIIPDQGFVRDTSISRYSIIWHNPDSAYILLRGTNLEKDDSVFVSYYAMSTDLDTTADTCAVPDDWKVDIVEEMMIYFQEYLQQHQVAGQMWQENRVDMGLVKPK